MNQGTEYHKRKFKRKEKIEKKNFWVEDKELGIAGFVDFEEETKEEIIIGDYKEKREFKKIPKHYKMQLIAEALAIKRETKPIKVQIRLPQGRKIMETIKEKEKKELIEALREIKKIKKTELIPAQTKHENKCKDCEYKNICQPL